MNNFSEFISSTFEKMKGVADVNSVVGAPITTPDGTTLIPISKITMGIAGAGGDFDTAEKKGKLNFTGGTGAGASVTPVAFIVINNGNTRVLYVNQSANNTVDRIIDMVPQTFDKITSYIDDKKKEKEVKVETTQE